MTELTRLRNAVLERLEAVLKGLVFLIGKQKGLPQGILTEAGGKVFHIRQLRTRCLWPQI